MRVEDLLNNPPLLHDDEVGRPVSWGIGEDVLRFLDGRVRPDFRTLETGAGLSTIVFTITGAFHTCVTPSRDEVARIQEYCLRNQISLDRVTFRTGISEKVLPQLAAQELDVVLIDGRHGFPAPFIDWYYTASHLKIGGLLLIDDTQLWPCKILQEFLAMEPEWQFVESLGKTAVFSKLTNGSEGKEWNKQQYTVLHSAL